MTPRETFGELLGDRLHAEHRPTITARLLRHADIAVTEVASGRPTRGRSDSLHFDAAYIAILQLRDFPRHEWWEDGRQAPVTGLRAGDLSICDLRRDPRFTINAPFHSVHVHLPLSLIAAVRRESGATGAGAGGELRWSPGQGVDDPVFRHLVQSLRPAIERPHAGNRLFVDAVTLAIATHVAITYGAAAPGRRSGGAAAGALSGVRLRRALDLIDARLDGTLGVTELAGACGLSPSHFVQAFRRATGCTPHRWQTQRRIERAKELLRAGALPLSQVALTCGFANQSHFTRAFCRATGMPPGAWRRVT
jgi:AraC-like DNA-binding protein